MTGEQRRFDRAKLLHAAKRRARWIQPGTPAPKGIRIEILQPLGKLLARLARKRWHGIERLDQRDNYGGRIVGTTLRHSDYAGMARALGLHAERVGDPADRADALRRALDLNPTFSPLHAPRAAALLERLGG